MNRAFAAPVGPAAAHPCGGRLSKDMTSNQMRAVARRLDRAGAALPKWSAAQWSVAATFATGALVLAVVGAAVLAQAPVRVVRVSPAGSRGVSETGASAFDGTTSSATICQAGEVVPAGISAIRVAIWGFFGARLRVTAYHGSQLVTEGARGGNWTSDSVTVPVRSVSDTRSAVKLCVAIGPNSEPLLLLGPREPPQRAAVLLNAGAPVSGLTSGPGSTLPGRLTIEYLAPGRRSWWSQILPVARRLGLGRAYSGTWIALLIAALMLAVGALTVRVAIREMR